MSSLEAISSSKSVPEVHLAARRALVVLCLAALGAVAAASCRADSPSEPVAAVAEVRVAISEQRMIIPELSVFGTIVYRNKAEVYPEADGVLDEVFVEQGDPVVAGELLGRLRQERLALQVQRSEAALAQAAAALEVAQAREADAARAVESRALELLSSDKEVSRRARSLAQAERDLHRAERLQTVDGAPPERVEKLREALYNARTAYEQAILHKRRLEIGFRIEDLPSELVPYSDAGTESPPNANDGLAFAEARAAFVALQTRSHRAEVALAEARVSEAETELNELRTLLSRAELRAPIDGVVADRHLHPGERATVQQAVFSLINSDELLLEVEVDELSHSRMAPGQTARVVVDDREQHELPAQVAFIAPYVNARTRTARVSLLIDDYEHRSLKPGLFARAAIELGPAAPTVLVPEPAIRNKHDDPHLYIVTTTGDGSRVFRNAITPLTETRAPTGFVAISGLKPGAEVVLQPERRQFRDGEQVEVIE